MVDLIGQYNRIRSEVDTAILKVIGSGNFINGPEVKSFQNNLEKYLGVNRVITCANGTDALQIALMALGLNPGDEVIVPAFTYVATAEVIALLRLKPVWVEVDKHTFNLDVSAFEDAITPDTKAVVPVHLFGQCANMEAILRVAKKHNLFVIEDTAQAIGCKYSFSDGKTAMAGTMGDIGCTSFFPSKNLGCFGDGGAIYTNNKTLADKMQMIANHGQAIKYQHDILGVNSRLDTLQAAILEIKLKHLDEYCARRSEAASIYDGFLKNISQIEIPSRASNSFHVFNQYTLIIKDGSRNQLKEHLKDVGIPTMIYYPIPMHLQVAYFSDQYSQGAFPVAEELAQSVLSLPIHTELDTETQKYICNSIIKFYNR